MSTVIDIHTRKPLDVRTVTTAERMQALLLAQMNQERADLCVKGQEGLRTFFEMNAVFLRSVANERA